jgi:hypothetical protein
MEPGQGAETTLRIPFWFAHAMLTFYTQQVKTYWRVWGPIGQPVIWNVETWAEAQRWYLEALEATLITGSAPPTSQKHRATPPIDFFSGFGLLGSEDD